MERLSEEDVSRDSGGERDEEGEDRRVGQREILQRIIYAKKTEKPRQSDQNRIKRRKAY